MLFRSVKAVNDLPSGSIAVVLINGEEATVKKIIKKENILVLEAANPAVDNRYYSLKEVAEIPIQIIGQVLYSKVEF